MKLNLTYWRSSTAAFLAVITLASIFWCGSVDCLSGSDGDDCASLICSLASNGKDAAQHPADCLSSHDCPCVYHSTAIPVVEQLLAAYVAHGPSSPFYILRLIETPASPMLRPPLA